MSDAPAPAPAPSPAPAPPPTSKAPRPPARRFKYSDFLILVLLGLCGALIFLGMRHRAEAGRLAARERRGVETLSRVEHMRSLLQRADRVARYPGLTAGDVEDVRGYADQLIERANDTMEKAKTSDIEVIFRLRGQAYELLHDFENARLDYEQSIKLVQAERSPAFFSRGLLTARICLRAMLLDPPPQSLEALVAELEDLRRGVATTDDQLLRNIAHAAYGICNNDLEGAITCAKGGLVSDEHDWWCRLIKGIAHLKKKELKEAIEDLNDASRSYPYGAEVNAWRAKCLLAMGERVRAMDALLGALAVDAGFYEAYVLRGRLLHEDGQFEAARQHYANAAKLRETEPEPRRGLALAAYEAWLRSDKKNASILDAAAEAATFYLGRNPQDASTYLLRARIHLARGPQGREAAERDALETVKLQPALGEAYLVLAATRTDPAAAAADYELAAKYSPDRNAHLHARQERARALVRAGIADKARAEYDELAKESPEDASIALERGRLLLAMKLLDEAAAAAEALTRQYPTNARAQALRAETLLAKADLPGALAAATMAWGLDPTDGAPLILRGRVYAKQGERELARKDWQKARDLLPERAAEIDALLKTLD